MRPRLRIFLLLTCLWSCLAANAAASTPDIGTSADRILDRLVDPMGPGVSVIVFRDDKVVYRSARGLASVELGVHSRPGNVYRIGSLTKTMTAATILTLARQGRLSLDDSLSMFLPDFPNGKDVTIAELLHHTAGISDAWDSDPATPLDTKASVKLIAGQPFDFKPGSQWRYSNSGYILLGAVIEKVSGKSWDQAEHDLLFTPLHMTDTGYHPDHVVIPGFVEGYSTDDAGRLARPGFASIAGPAAAGALCSTVDDLLRLIRGLADPGTSQPSLFQAMAVPAPLADGRTAPYGYGVMLGDVRGEPSIEHNGGIEGFTAHYVYLPRRRIAVVTLANTDAGIPNPRSITRQLAALAMGKPYRRFQDVELTPTRLQALAGAYRIQGGSKHVLSVDHGKLFVRRDQGPARPLMTAASDDLYYVGDGTDYYHVVKGHEGRVIGLDFHADGAEAVRREMRIEE